MIKEKILLLLGFLSIFSLFLRPPTDPDLFWHLRNGEIIVEQQRFPLEDEFTHTFPGYKWADSYWLSEVIFFAFYKYLGKSLGPFSLSFIFAFLTTAAFYIFPVLAQKSRRILVILGVTFFGALLSFVFTGIRPQMISVVFSSLLWLLLRRSLLSGRVRFLILIPALFLLWANLHAGFVLGLGLFFLFNFFESLRFIFKNSSLILNNWLLKEATFNFWQIKRLWGVFFLCGVATLANPYGLFLHQTILKDATSVQIKAGIQEWQAVDFHSELGLLFLIYLTLWLSIFLINFRKTHPAEAFLAFGFSCLALGAIRHIPLFVIITLPYILENFFVFHKATVSEATPYEEPSMSNFILAYILGFFTLLPILFGAQSLWRLYKTTRDPYELAKEGGYPFKAVEYLKANPQLGNVFNTYGWGGYLILNLPEEKVFIDGRMPGWTLGKDNVFADYRTIYYLGKDFEEVLKKYKVSWVIVESDVYLASVLRVSSEWKVRYEDETSVIFSRQLSGQE